MSANEREREREAALVAAYARLPKAEPSPELDAAVLARARAAVAPRRGARWPALLATAATLTLAVGVAWQLREAEDRAEAQRASEAPPAEGAGSSGPAQASVEDDAVAGDSMRSVAPQPAPVDAAPPPASPAAVPPPAPRRQAAPTSESARKRDAAQSRNDEERALRDAAPPVEWKAAEESFAADPPPPPPAPAPAAAAAANASSAKVEARALELDEATPQAQPTRTVPTRDATARAEDSARDAAGEHESEDAASRTVFEEPLPMSAPAPEPGVDALARPAPAAGTRLGAAARTPEQWLAEIERLRAAGERARAIAELRKFRAAYPEFELPPSLRDLPR